MAKKSKKSSRDTSKKKSLNQKSLKNFSTNLPEKTGRSKGYYWIKPYKSGSWGLVFESWQDGKKKSIFVPRPRYREYGLNADMSISDAKKEITSYNILRKEKGIGIDLKQIRAMRRVDAMTAFNSAHFPADITAEFLERLKSGSDGQRKFKQRLERCFQIVQEMTITLNLKPHEYAEDLDRMIKYFKEVDRQYSVSYCQDILYVLNKWGGFYSRKKGTFFDPVPSLRNKTKYAITVEQKTKKQNVRRPSLPMTTEVLARVKNKIQNSSLSTMQDMQFYNWLFITYAFGLRPSETDAVLKNTVMESLNGIMILVAIQTKLTAIDDDEKIKRIPIICVEQEEAMDLILKNQAKRPKSKWVDEFCKDPNKIYTRLEKYDLYASRKGFTDFIMSKGQDLEKASIYCGHKNIQTTWKYYKDRKSAAFNPNDFTTDKISKNLSVQNKSSIISLAPTGTEDKKKED